VKVLPPNNYEIFLGDLNSDKQVRLTYNNAFDGYPSISPDGHWLVFTSTRDSAPGPTQPEFICKISRVFISDPRYRP